jgi:hypothetical protein
VRDQVELDLCGTQLYLIFLARAAVLVKNVWPLNAAEILCPEANTRSPHKNQTTSDLIWSIAEQQESLVHELESPKPVSRRKKIKLSMARGPIVV